MATAAAIEIGRASCRERRCVPDSLAAGPALKDQQKMAPVNHPRGESTLPLPLSLSTAAPVVLSVAAPAPRAQYEFFLALFFLAKIAAPAVRGRQPIAPAS